MPKPHPIPETDDWVDGWTEDDQRVIDNFDAQQIADQAREYDPYA